MQHTATLTAPLYSTLLQRSTPVLFGLAPFSVESLLDLFCPLSCAVYEMRRSAAVDKRNQLPCFARASGLLAACARLDIVYCMLHRLSHVALSIAQIGRENLWPSGIKNQLENVVRNEPKIIQMLSGNFGNLKISVV